MKWINRLMKVLLACFAALAFGASIPLTVQQEVHLSIEPGAERAVAVMVPFRSWHKTLDHSIQAIKHCLGPWLNFTIFVFEQIDSTPFNKGLLLNSGFLTINALAPNRFDYFMVHDVDTVCDRNEVNWFPVPTEERPLHVTPMGLHPSGFYPAFMGGNMIYTRSQYERINGYTTRCFGHGKEDDNMVLRLMMHNMLMPEVVRIEGVFGTPAVRKMADHLVNRPFTFKGLWRNIDERCDGGGSVRIHSLVERNARVAAVDTASGLNTSAHRLLGVVQREGHVRLQFDLSDAFFAELGFEEASALQVELMARGSRAIP